MLLDNERTKTKTYEKLIFEKAFVGSIATENYKNEQHCTKTFKN